MSRFQDFTPRERVVLHEGLLSVAATSDPGVATWAEAAEVLISELELLWSPAETTAADGLNREGEIRERQS